MRIRVEGKGGQNKGIKYRTVSVCTVVVVGPAQTTEETDNEK